VVEAADHLQVLGPGQVLVDRRVLAGEADLAAQRRRLAGDVETGDAGAAAVERQQPSASIATSVDTRGTLPKRQ
jgi:hypothetical protein